MITIDLRQIAFATIGKKYEQALNNEETKQAIRNGEVTYKFADYCNVDLGKNTKTIYKKDGKEIEIDTKAIIEKYCAENGIEIVKETRENYKITFKPSQKAYNEYNKMLTEIEGSQYLNLSRIATRMKSKIK